MLALDNWEARITPESLSIVAALFAPQALRMFSHSSLG